MCDYLECHPRGDLLFKRMTSISWIGSSLKCETYVGRRALARFDSDGSVVSQALLLELRLFFYILDIVAK